MLLRYTFVVLLMSFLSFEAVPLDSDSDSDDFDSENIDTDNAKQENSQENFVDCWVDKNQKGECVVYFRCSYIAPGDDDKNDDVKNEFEIKAIVSSRRTDSCKDQNYLHVCCPVGYSLPETKVPVPNQAVRLPKLK